MTRHLGLTFTDELAQAAHDGRKTVTRRPMKPQPPAVRDPVWHEWDDGRCDAHSADADLLTEALLTTEPPDAD